MVTKAPFIQLSVEGLSRAEVLVLLCETFRGLNWGMEHLHPMRVVAQTPQSAFSWGEQIVVELSDHGLVASSRSKQWSPLASKDRHLRNLEKFAECFAGSRASISPETMSAELKELEESGVLQQDASTAHANEFHWKDIGSFFIPNKSFFATPLLIDISVLVYIAMVATGVHFIEPTGEDLLKWGANWRGVTQAGEWWRTLSCCFVHIGLFHLLLNMYALAMVGVYLEPIVGRWRVFLLYVVTGVCASLASLWWHENTVSAGASGAIFGLYGVFLALLTTDIIHREVRKGLLQSIGVFVVYNLVYGLKGGIDNAAHIGGLISGLVLGYGYYLGAVKLKTVSGLAGSLTLPSVALLATGYFMANNAGMEQVRYARAIEQFTRLQEQGLALYRAGEDASVMQQIQLVQDSCLPAWDQAVELLHGIEGSKLDANTSWTLDLLMAYAEERLFSMRSIEAELNAGRNSMTPELEASYARVDSIVGLLNANNGSE